MPNFDARTRDTWLFWITALLVLGATAISRSIASCVSVTPLAAPAATNSRP